MAYSQELVVVENSRRGLVLIIMFCIEPMLHVICVLLFSILYHIPALLATVYSQLCFDEDIVGWNI